MPPLTLPKSGLAGAAASVDVEPPLTLEKSGLPLLIAGLVDAEDDPHGATLPRLVLRPHGGEVNRRLTGVRRGGARAEPARGSPARG